MKKVIRAWGREGIGIYFNTDERKIYDLHKGDFIEIEITKLAKSRGKRK